MSPWLDPIDYFLWILIGGYITFLSHAGVAIFQTEFRIAYQEFQEKKVSPQQILQLGLSTGALFLLTVAFPNSLVTGILLIPLIFSFTDVIGLYFKKSLGSTILSISLGVLVTLLIVSINHLFRYFVLETSYFGNLQNYLFYQADRDNLFTYFRIGVLMVPAIGIGIQFGPKQSINASLSTLIIYLGVTVLSGFTLFGLDIRLPIDPYETTVTMMVAFYVIKAFMQKGTETTHHELAIRTQPFIRQIQSKKFFLMISGSLLAVASSRLLFGLDVFSLALFSVNLPYVGVLVMTLVLLSEISPLYTSFTASGIYHPYGTGLVVVVGVLLHILIPNPYQMILAAILGAGIMYAELEFINPLALWLDRIKGIRKMGENTHTALTLIFDFTLLIGGMPIAHNLFPTVGPLVLFGTWLMNRNMKKKFLSTYAVVPIIVILLGLAASLFKGSV